MAAAPEAQLAWLSAALDEFEGFLLSPDTFRPSGGFLPRDLSLGNVLLAVDAVSAGMGGLSLAQRAEASRVLRRWETERSRRPVAVEAKALAEAGHRLHVWGAYLQDLRETPAEASRYRVEVRQRVVLARLLELLGRRTEAEPARARLDSLDAALRSHFLPGLFVWEAALEAVYPRDSFWFLYGELSS